MRFVLDIGVDCPFALVGLKVHAEQVTVKVARKIVYTVFLECDLFVYPNGICKLLEREYLLVIQHIGVIVLTVGEGVQNLGEILYLVVGNTHGVQYFISCFTVRTLGRKSESHIDRHGRDANIGLLITVCINLVGQLGGKSIQLVNEIFIAFLPCIRVLHLHLLGCMCQGITIGICRAG